MRSMWQARALSIGVLAFASLPASAEPRIVDGEYVRLEVSLKLGSGGPMHFLSSCPKSGVWAVDLKSMFGSSDHAVLGTAISGPQVPKMVLTPLTVDRKATGFLGLGRSCEVDLDQIRYASPVLSVGRHHGEQFSVAPSFSETRAANPAIGDTVKTAIGIATRLAGVPAEAAAPYQREVLDLLSAVRVESKETLGKALVIETGPVPADSENQWIVPGLFRNRQTGRPEDLVLTARLVPIPTLMPTPPPGPAGSPGWSVSYILASRFDPDPSSSGAGSFGSYAGSKLASSISDLAQSQSVEAAGNACNALKQQVDDLGLSNRDVVLVMWALTHRFTPRAPLTAGQLDHLGCLEDTWAFAPPEVAALRRADVPPLPDAAAPSIREMRVAAELGDAFARQLDQQRGGIGCTQDLRRFLARYG